jgi:hypothetical protein
MNSAVQQPKRIAAAAHAPQPRSLPMSPFSPPYDQFSLPSCLLPSSQARCLSYHTILSRPDRQLYTRKSFNFKT